MKGTPRLLDRRRPWLVFACCLLSSCYLSHEPERQEPSVNDGGVDALDAAPPSVPWSDPALHVAVGTSHACVALQSGRVACWGADHRYVLAPEDACDRSGSVEERFVATPTFVEGVEGIEELAISGHMSCGRRTNGQVWCWGRRTSSDCDYHAPERLAGVEAVSIRGSVRNDGFCALDDEGTVICWTQNLEPRRIEGLPRVRAISVSPFAACALHELGVTCFSASSGELYETHPAEESALALGAAGASDYCVLEVDGGIRCHGSAQQPFRGAYGEDPQHVPALPAVDGFSLSTHQNACAWNEEGALWCFGSNAFLQLGSGDNQSHRQPSRVDVGPVRQAAVGPTVTCAVLRDGGVACWGTGWLGNGELPYQSEFRPVQTSATGEFFRADALGLSVDSSCGTTDGALQCWGGAENGAATRAFFPARVPLRAGVESACGRSCALLDDATLHCRTSLELWSEEEGVDLLTCGTTHECVVQSGHVQCAGNSQDGRLGDGDDSLNVRRARVEGLEGIVELAVGWGHACARSSTGDVYCWGSNRHGQSGSTTGELQLSPHRVMGGADEIEAGGNTSCARVGERWSCWGWLRTVDPLCPTCSAPDTSPRPVDFGPLGESLKLSSHFACSLRSGSVACAGLPQALGDVPAGWNYEPRTYDIDDAVELSVQAARACIRRHDRSVWCMGSNLRGLLGVAGAGVASSPMAVTQPR